jgi:hypothetical protein
VSKEYLSGNMPYEKGWNDAFDAIANYVEAEVCLVTAEMIRRMKHETWRTGVANEKDSNSIHTDSDASAG